MAAATLSAHAMSTGLLCHLILSPMLERDSISMVSFIKYIFFVVVISDMNTNLSCCSLITVRAHVKGTLGS